jgi:hypothetical protein
MTFKITENDVGRMAVTRDGRLAKVSTCRPGESRRVLVEMKDSLCRSGYWVAADGLDSEERSDDLVAWADEQDQEEPDSKEQVPRGPSGAAIRDCPELISISRVANGWVVHASQVDGQQIGDHVALTQSDLLDVIRKLTGDE